MDVRNNQVPSHTRNPEVGRPSQQPQQRRASVDKHSRLSIGASGLKDPAEGGHDAAFKPGVKVIISADNYPLYNGKV